MYDAEQPASESELDELLIDPRLAGLEPVAPRRSSGEIYDSPMLGQLEFFAMPYGRPSFWRGEQRMPDSRYPLQIVCEVERDDLPGSDQVACVAAFRRLQVQDAMLSTPLINARLAELHPPRTIGVDDLVLTSIHLPPHPLIAARFELGFRATTIPHLTFTVIFMRGTPRSVRLDSDS
jgi:hypothetical protein